MKTVSPELLLLLRSGSFLIADLYTISLVTGTVLRWTDFDTDLPFGGDTWSCQGPVLRRTNVREVIGLEVGTLDVEIYPRAGATVAGLPIAAAAVAGVFDGADLRLDRAYIKLDGSSKPTVVGIINKFWGDFADQDIVRSGVKVRVNSRVARLALQLPRHLYEAACSHVLYDTRCGVSRASKAVTGAAQAGSTTLAVACGLAQATGWFDQGYIVFDTGALAGVRRTVKRYVPGSVSVFNPLPAIPEPGAAFTIYPGCDRTRATCVDKFANGNNFRGCDLIPVPETAL